MPLLGVEMSLRELCSTRDDEAEAWPAWVIRVETWAEAAELSRVSSASLI